MINTFSEYNNLYIPVHYFALFLTEGTKNRMPDRDYHSMTVERLRALLKEKGLSPRGKKARIYDICHLMLQIFPNVSDFSQHCIVDAPD